MSDQPKALPPLPLKRKRFCEEYLLDGNATQAAIRAGYSPASAYSMGTQLLGFIEVREYLAELEDGRAQRVGFAADEVLAELATLVRSNVEDYIADEDGNLALREGAQPNAMRAVASVKRKVRWIPQEDDEPIKEVEVEFRLWDKNAAIDKAMKHLGLLREQPATQMHLHLTKTIVQVFGKDIEL